MHEFVSPAMPSDYRKYKVLWLFCDGIAQIMRVAVDSIICDMVPLLMLITFISVFHKIHKALLVAY